MELLPRINSPDAIFAEHRLLNIDSFEWIEPTKAALYPRIQLVSAFAFAAENLRTSSDTRGSSLARCQNSRAAVRASSHTSKVSDVACGNAKARGGTWPAAVGAYNIDT